MTKKVEALGAYDKVLEMVREGITIAQALDVLKIDRHTFYKYISLEQKGYLLVEKLMSKEFNPTTICSRKRNARWIAENEKKRNEKK